MEDSLKHSRCLPHIVWDGETAQIVSGLPTEVFDDQGYLVLVAEDEIFWGDC